jgi:uncharacterized phage protein (predicted DNA packaging)
MPTWENYSITLKEAKEYLKVEHNLEDTLIEKMTAAAIQKAKQRTNREFIEVPPDVDLAILKIIAFWYENRSDQNKIPATADEILLNYYRWPGL